MNKKSVIVALGIIIAIVLLILLIVYSSKPVNYAVVDLPTDNFIDNQSSKPHLDTVVAIGMEELGISGCSVRIRDMNEQLRNNPGASGLELGAAIFGSGNSYLIYVDPSIDKREVITVMSHELIHLRQYFSEDLMIINGSAGIVKWKGEEMNVLNLEYNLRPWEVEAFAEQRNLAKDIMRILLPEN
jgi:hypothetical protein